MVESSAVVIGGGITGLVAAYRLQQVGATVTLLEKNERVGGCIRTVNVDGFVMEEGPDVFIARKPAAAALCRELGLVVQDTLPQPRRAYILDGGALRALPGGFSGLVPTSLVPLLRTRLLTVRGKVRLLMDFVIPARRGGADESISSFYRRRLGNEAFEVLVEPLISGITGGAPEDLSLLAGFGHLRAAEIRYGGLLRMMARQPSKGPALHGIQGGMQSLPRALAAKLGDVRLGAEAATVTRFGKYRYKVDIRGRDAVEARMVVVTLPAYAAGAILKGLDQVLSTELNQIHYGSVGVVHLAFRTCDVPMLLDSYGYIVPSKESRPVVACTWSSAKLAGRAPDGFVLFRLFLRSGLEGEAAADRLQGLAKTELRETLGISADPVLQRCRIWHRALPRCRLGHLEVVARLEERLKHAPGLEICGAFLGGAGLPDRIMAGYRSADAWLRSSLPR